MRKHLSVILLTALIAIPTVHIPETLASRPTPLSSGSWENTPVRAPEVPSRAYRAPETPLAGDALVIAACESGARLPNGRAQVGTHDWKAENGSSSASGAFQFIDGTWEWVWGEILGAEPPTVRAKEATPAQQLEAFEALWSDGEGAAHWSASRSCWEQMLD